MEQDFEIELGLLIEKWRQYPDFNIDAIIEGLDHYVILLEDRQHQEMAAIVA